MGHARHLPPTGPTVALVGDSLLAMALPQVEQEFADYDLSIDARPGWTIDMQLENAIDMAGDQPDAMIIVLGANDSSPEAFSRTGMEQDVARLLDSIGTVPCIRWVTVQEDFYFDSLSAGSVGTLTLNVTLFREAAVRPNLEVVDFAPIINDQPEWHVMDLLHLDDRGSQAMAELMADSLDCLDEVQETAPVGMADGSELQASQDRSGLLDDGGHDLVDGR